MEYLKDKKPLFYVGAVVCILSLLAALVLAITGFSLVNKIGDVILGNSPVEFERVLTPEEEEYADGELAICPVEYVHIHEDKTGNKYEVSLIINYTYEEWEALGDATTTTGYVCYEKGTTDFFAIPVSNADLQSTVNSAVKNLHAEKYAVLFEIAMALAMFAIGVGLAVFFDKQFTTYEKIWFLSILTLAGLFSILFPEESANGVNGLVIMLLYLLDTLFNILCELLISKQSRWNFIVSVLVEITEIVICIVLAYRFATMVTTLFFWLPIDIISFINWSKKPDQENEELTRVRTLKGWQEILIIAGIAVWTIVVGYFLSGLDIATDIFGGDEVLKNVVCYLDACASAVGIVNGLTILFRFREQWIAWYICSILEAIINILAGQYVLLVLKAGYLTNTTYGYIKWSKYIKEHPEVCEEKTFF